MDTGRRCEKIGDILYAFLRGLVWLGTHLICRYQVHGREQVPQSGPLLIVANHLSWYDPLLFGIVLPRRVWFFTKKEIFRWPLVGWLVRATGQIPVARGSSDRVALQRALAYLHEGKALVIFPEGAVEKQERMIAAHTGAAMLALRSEATILPIAHTGTRRILRPHGGWFPRVVVRIGEPYVPARSASQSRKASLQAITDEMMGRIASMLAI